ncbi:MAG TPA: hypothetical protein VLL08_18425 [Kineosporiaceae bacterium]|nr:hypothetical protein [Kineosporiaceae bacterium]
MNAQRATRDDQASCVCVPAWPQLTVHLEGGREEVAQPAPTGGPTAGLYYARCAQCGALYPGPFRLRRAG